MSAAVILAMKHLESKVGDAPIYLLGYSNGGALSVMYALDSLEDSSLPRADGLILLSPAIGVSPAAALAVWQGRIGRWFG
jgi:alpha-beta hydrolase superfamily lysophospholipase